MGPQDDSGIEDLKNRLYSRNNAPKPRARRNLRPDTHEVQESWQSIDDKEAEYMKKHEKKEPLQRRVLKKKQRATRSVLSIILLVSFGFFLISTAIAAYLFFGGGNTVSADNIDIEINGPIASPGGEPLSLQFGIVNRNSIPIESASLIIDYPDGTRSAQDITVSLDRFREELGSISPGERHKTSARAVLFGAEDTEEQILVTLEYRIEGSNALFYKEKTYDVLISSAPVALTLDSVTELSSGQEVELTLKAKSNAAGILEDILVVGSYPFGFEFQSAQPQPVAGNNVWDLGDLEPGDEREILVRGILTGQDTEKRIFKFETGVRSEQSQTEIEAPFYQAESQIVIKQPFINLALLLNDKQTGEDQVVPNNELIEGTVQWRNTLSDPLYDVELVASFNGNILDRRTIDSRDGFYRSQDDTVIWNNQTNSDFRKLEPGQAGSVSFSFSPVELTPTSGLEDPAATIVISVRGRRISEDNVPEIIESSIERRIIVSSEMYLIGDTLYSAGPFENSGPVPPRVEERTTYTLTLGIANTFNGARDVVLTTQVPWYVEWLDVVSPEDANISFNTVSGDLVWRVGDIPAGTGYTSPAQQLQFQVAVEPSLSQAGQRVNLLLPQTVRGVDARTGTVLQTSGRALTTELGNDPMATRNSGTVRE